MLANGRGHLIVRGHFYLGFGIWDLGFGIWDLGFGILKKIAHHHIVYFR
jgi:hypothetical protein